MCKQPEYWSALLCEVQTVSWMASTGLPLFLTIIGLYLAVRLVKRQLKSDRKLRSADRRQEASNRLGIATLEETTRFRHAQLRDDWWTSNTWESQPILTAQVSDAGASLPAEIIDHFQTLVQDIGDAWVSCQVAVRRSGLNPDRANHVDSVRYVLNPYVDALDASAETLRRWNGEDPPPTLESNIDHSRRDRSQWSRARQEEYEQRLAGKRGLRLHKPIGEQLWPRPLIARVPWWRRIFTSMRGACR